MSRKLVAVGTARLASILATMRAPTPRMGSPTGVWSAAGSGTARRADVTAAGSGWELAGGRAPASGGRGVDAAGSPPSNRARHSASTEPGSASHRSRISSMIQALVPRASLGSGGLWSSIAVNPRSSGG